MHGMAPASWLNWSTDKQGTVHQQISIDTVWQAVLNIETCVIKVSRGQWVQWVSMLMGA